MSGGGGGGGHRSSISLLRRRNPLTFLPSSCLKKTAKTKPTFAYNESYKVKELPQ